jgi:hypothetical protein
VDSTGQEEDQQDPDGVVVQLGSLLQSVDSEEDSDDHESTMKNDSFLPKPCSSWEYPLTKSEKQLLYTRLCDQERASVVRDYNRLVRRVSVGGDRPEWSSDESESEEEDEKLQSKERELERQLEHVRADRRRLSGSNW